MGVIGDKKRVSWGETRMMNFDTGVRRGLVQI